MGPDFYSKGSRGGYGRTVWGPLASGSEAMVHQTPWICLGGAARSEGDADDPKGDEDDPPTERVRDEATEQRADRRP